MSSNIRKMAANDRARPANQLPVQTQIPRRPEIRVDRAALNKTIGVETRAQKIGPSPESVGFIELFAGQRSGWNPRTDRPAFVALAPVPDALPPLCEAWVPNTDVVGAGAQLIGRAISEPQAIALMTAHRVGIGELGKDRRRPAAIGNFTPEHIHIKARILHDAGFSIEELRALIKAGVVGAANVDAAHYAITNDLYNGQVIEAHPFNANGNHTQIYWVKLRNPHNGSIREALFKPRMPGDNDGWGRTPMEYVAYALNRMLGMDYVPPVAYRRNVEADFKHFAEGAMLYMVPDAHLLHPVPVHDWGRSKERFLSDTRILDVLIHNPDRQRPNYLRGKHWVDGSYKPMLIDHAAGLRPRTVVELGQNDAFGAGPIKIVRRSTFEALKNLNFDWLKREIGEFVSDGEIRGMLARRDGMIAYFEKRIAEQGFDKVVV